MQGTQRWIETLNKHRKTNLLTSDSSSSNVSAVSLGVSSEFDPNHSWNRYNKTKENKLSNKPSSSPTLTSPILLVSLSLDPFVQLFREERITGEKSAVNDYSANHNSSLVHGRIVSIK